MTEPTKKNIPAGFDAREGHGLTQDPVQAARLMRVAVEADLSQLTRRDVEADLIAIIEDLCFEKSADTMLHDTHVMRAGAVSETTFDQVAETMAIQQPDFGQSYTNEGRQGALTPSHVSPHVARETADLPHQHECAALEFKLRQLAQIAAPWERMEPLALELFEWGKTPQHAARIIELAFLHAKLEQVTALLARFRLAAPGFYRAIHPAVRTHIVGRIYALDFANADLGAILFTDRDADYLEPAERLFLLLSLMQRSDGSHAYIYFNRYQKPLLAAVQGARASFGLSPGAFYLKMARLAADLGYPAETRDLLEKIQKDAPEWEEALVLLLHLDADGSQGLSPYAAELEASPGDRSRLDKLAFFLATTRSLGGYRDRNRTGLNDILRDPLAWFGELPDIWASLSQLIVSSRDLEPLLPNIWQLFKSKALKWYAPQLDAALWAGPVKIESDRPIDLYWKGLAKLHFYFSTQGTDGAALWEARELIHHARQNMATKGDLFDWPEIHRAAFAWAAKSPHFSEPERTRALCELRLASPDSSTSLADVEQYLNQTPAPVMATLHRLTQITQAKKALALEARVLITRGFIGHLTNADLNRLWQIACERKDHDLAWRVATVGKGRGALAKTIVHPWDISGEKRTHYQSLQPSFNQVSYCLFGLSKTQERLAKALMMVGPMLPELLSVLDSKSTSVRISAAPSDSVEAQIDHALGRLDWLPIMRKRFVYSYDQAGEQGDIPAFAQVMPANPWSTLVMALSQRLGISAWRWRLSLLAQQIVDVIPRLATNRDLGRHSSKVAKWLRALTPDQRAAWHELSSLTRNMNDEEALLGMGRFICRTATLILPNHAQALGSLMAMRAPVAIIWDLEQFILSPIYSEYRQLTGVVHKVPVPNSLLSLTSVLETSPQS